MKYDMCVYTFNCMSNIMQISTALYCQLSNRRLAEHVLRKRQLDVVRMINEQTNPASFANDSGILSHREFQASFDGEHLRRYKKGGKKQEWIKLSPNVSEEDFETLRANESLIEDTSDSDSGTVSLADNPSTDRRTSWVITVLSILGMVQGATFLAIPYMVSRGGLVVLLSTLLVGVMTCYSCIAIIDCQYEESKSRPGVWKRVYTTYIAVGKAALPQPIGGTVMTLITLSSLLTDVYVFILMGQATKDLIRDVKKLSHIDYTIIWAFLLLPCLFITRISVLSWFMAISLFLFIGVTAMIYFYLFLNISDLNLEHLEQPFSLRYLLIGHGVALNSFNFHWVVPAVEGSMRSPEKATSAFVISTLLSILIKLSVAFLAVSILGLQVQQSITSNLFTNYYVSVTANATLLLCAYLYLPIGMFVIYEMLDTYVLPHFTLFTDSGIRFRIWQLLSRLLILLSVMFVAVSIPQFGLVVSAVGNIRGTVVALVLPLYCHLKLKWKTMSVGKKVLEIVTIVISSVMSVGGTYYSIKEIVYGLQRN